MKIARTVLTVKPHFRALRRGAPRLESVGMPLPPDRFYYSPIVERPRFRWPNGARVAFWVAPNVEFYEYLPQPDGVRDPWPRTPAPDVREYGYRDYGNRVGFWRMLDVLDKHRIRCGVSLNLAVLEHHPEIGEAMIQRNWDFMSHGIYNTRYLNACTEEEEREFYRDSIETLHRLTGKTLKGMLAPAFSGTERTPDLMAEANLEYLAGWTHDDQPFPFKVRSGRLISMPYSVELNDSPVFLTGQDADYFYRIGKAQFDRLYQDGERSGMVMCVAVHPWRIGLPHRVKWFDALLGYVMSHSEVWQATSDEIADYYLAHCYDDVLAHAQDLERSSTSGAPKWPPIPPTFGGRRETLRPPLSS